MAKGVGCYSCHGPVDEMPLMYAENTLQMEWCLNCHREPEKFLRPKEEVFNMQYQQPSSEHVGQSGSTGKSLYQPVGAGYSFAEEISPAHDAGHNQLLHLPPIGWKQYGNECLTKAIQIPT